MSVSYLCTEFFKKNWLLLTFTISFATIAFVLDLVVLPTLSSKLITYSYDSVKIKKYIMYLFTVWVLIQLCWCIIDKCFEIIDSRCKQFVTETLVSRILIRMDQDPDTINVAKVYNLIDQVQTHITTLFFYMIRIIPRMIAILFSITNFCVLQLSVGITILISYLIIIIFIIWFISRNNSFVEREEHQEEILDKMNEEFVNVNMIRTIPKAIDIEIDAIKKITQKQYDIEIVASDNIRRTQYITYLCIIIMTAFVFYLSYNNFKTGKLTTESFSTIIIAIIPLGTQINDIIWYIPDLSKSISTLSYYNNWIKEIYSYSMSPTIPPPSSCVYTFTNVTFSYPDQVPLLTNYSITLPTGLVWLRGESGAGKSTFIKLLLGTLLPQSGTITLGDTIVTPSIRQHVMYLHQHATSLFSTTIYSNIMYGIDENEQNNTTLHQLIDKYHLYSLFGCKAGDDSFLQFHVGTLGEHLSGGQRQMIHLLRCLILDRKLYIMDEPLTGLDPDTKTLVTRLLQDMITDGKTIFIISHDPLTFAGQHILDFVKGTMPTLVQ